MHGPVSVLHPRCFIGYVLSWQLRQLEERLLDTISAVEGTILDDDTVVKALEDLKGEAGDVAKEVRRNLRLFRFCVRLYRVHFPPCRQENVALSYRVLCRRCCHPSSCCS